MPPTATILESVIAKGENLKICKMCLTTLTESNAATDGKAACTCTNIRTNQNSNDSNLKRRKTDNSNDGDNNNNTDTVYKEKELSESMEGGDINENVEFKSELRWPDLLVQIFIHAGFLYGLYLLFYVKYQTILWVMLTVLASGTGITAGAHRLWSHKSYKANLPMRLLLVFLFTIAGQRDAYTWALDHRIHHKFSETEADPHNAKRGFFFAHVAWLFLTPTPQVVEKRKVIDMSDLENDKVVMFQRKFYIPLFALLVIALPVGVPCYYWGEDLWMSFWVNFNMRFCITLNIAFFVNSVAHMWGKRPYDKNISPVENIAVSIAALGEGWHNYHHVFPWDYKTGELGDYKFNITTAFIDFFAYIGWATNLKFVSPEMVARRAAKCGDGSHFLSDELAHKDQVWGYGDKDITNEDAVDLAKMK